MPWVWVSELLKGLATVLKMFFGMDKPKGTEIVENPKELNGGKSDAELLDELRALDRAAGENGGPNSKTGGSGQNP